MTKRSLTLLHIGCCLSHSVVWFSSKQRYSWHDFLCQITSREMLWAEQVTACSLFRLTETLWLLNLLCAVDHSWKAQLPTNLVQIVKQFHDGMVGRISMNGRLSETLYRWRAYVSVTFRYVVRRLKCQHEAEGRVWHFKQGTTYLNVTRTTVRHLFCRMTNNNKN